MIHTESCFVIKAVWDPWHPHPNWDPRSFSYFWQSILDILYRRDTSHCCTSQSFKVSCHNASCMLVAQQILVNLGFTAIPCHTASRWYSGHPLHPWLWPATLLPEFNLNRYIWLFWDQQYLQPCLDDSDSRHDCRCAGLIHRHDEYISSWRWCV